MNEIPEKTEPLVLITGDWMDAPHVVIEKLIAQEKGDIIIDASQAGDIPAQIAQLLVSCQRTAAERGAALQIQNPTETTKQCLADLGLAGLLLGDLEE